LIKILTFRSNFNFSKIQNNIFPNIYIDSERIENEITLTIEIIFLNTL